MIDQWDWVVLPKQQFITIWLCFWPKVRLCWCDPIVFGYCLLLLSLLISAESFEISPIEPIIVKMVAKNHSITGLSTLLTDLEAAIYAGEFPLNSLLMSCTRAICIWKWFFISYWHSYVSIISCANLDLIYFYGMNI